MSHRDGKLLQMLWFHEEEAVKCHNFLLKAVKGDDFFGKLSNVKAQVEQLAKKVKLWKQFSVTGSGSCADFQAWCSSHVIVKILMREGCS